MHGDRLRGIRTHIDPASLLVVALTLLLFVAALLVKGLGHDLLLEAGVFLVSVKLIMMAYKANVATTTLAAELASIRASLTRLESRTAGDRDAAIQSPPTDV
jgi:hypothetical protein